MISGDRPTSLRFKPWYWQRPSQVLVRARTSHTIASDGTSVCRLPWDLDIHCYADVIGRGIRRTGVFELVVTEAMMRLVTAGETVLDVGANIGYMSAVSALAAGPAGQVHAFEPHPSVATVLRRNTRSFGGDRRLAPITVHETALSDADGSATLVMPEDFERNHGTSRLGSAPASDESSVDVAIRRLEDVVTAGSVLKLDVEGHELSVLRGAARLFGEGGIRDVLYEDNDPDTTSWLKDRGFEIFGLSQGSLRPLLVAEDAPQRHWDARALLATREPRRAQALLGARFWRSLRRNPRRR
ncbi:MAG: hypothetical protein QOE11_3649 [Solirubrobacteraceae bacterium]|jgi:FkbM family methyltransferase|nr:hypothetical protein [Solirubrobacteraceae bacterium]